MTASAMMTAPTVKARMCDFSFFSTPGSRSEILSLIAYGDIEVLPTLCSCRQQKLYQEKGLAANLTINWTARLHKMFPSGTAEAAADGLTGERPPRAFGEFDGVFCARFLVVHFESQIDQFADQFAEGNSARFPQFWIHADRGEAGDGVRLVQIQLTPFFFEKEVDTSHTGELQRAKGFDCERLDFCDLRWL